MSPPNLRFRVRCPRCKMVFAHKAALRMHQHWKHKKASR